MATLLATSRPAAPFGVLMLCPQFRPLVGGYERAAERLSSALAGLGLRIEVITERRDRSWPRTELGNGYRLLRLPCWYRRRLHIVSSLTAFAAYLLWRGRDYAIWHVHQYGAHAGLAIALGKLMNRPVIFKLTSSGSHGIAESLGAGRGGRVLAALHRRADACVAISEETRLEAVRFGLPVQRVFLIPNGLDGHRFRSASPPACGVAREALGLRCALLVLCVGRLAPEKNPLGLVDAWGAIRDEWRADAQLALVGGGPQQDIVQARIRELGLTDSVQVVGERRDVATWYRAADLLVIPSQREGLSNTMLEALAYGLPIVSTRVSGSATLLQTPAAGLVVDVGATQQLADAIASLLRDQRMRMRLGEGARQRFEMEFDFAALLPRYLAMYRSLVRTCNPSRDR
jgi:glycosyltransferase involved in cell wall biosynthesis